VNAAHARYLEIRRLLLIGRLDEAESRLAELDPTPLPPALRAAHELVVAGIALRRLRTKTARAALVRAEHAARHAGIPALTAEVEGAAHAGTAFDGQHLYQIAEDRIQKIDPKTGRVLATIPAPGGSDSGLTWAEGTLWVGEYRDRKIHQIDPQTGTILRTIESNRFVTGVTWIDGELWHGTWEVESCPPTRIRRQEPIIGLGGRPGCDLCPGFLRRWRRVVFKPPVIAVPSHRIGNGLL
jgi:hypothetical protein